MKLFLINPDYMTYGDPPLGLAYLAAYIRENCDFLRINILDQLNEKEILKKIKKENPSIIGFTAVSSNYSYVKELAKKIKETFSDIILIIGGIHITTLPKSFGNSSFDIAVIGEGEICATKLIKSIKNKKGINIDELSKIKGLLFRKNKEIINTGLSETIENLDQIPFPARELLNMTYYSLPRFSSDKSIDPIGSLITSRGCPYSCKFCSSSRFWGTKVRFFSASRIIDEIELLHKKYNYSHIYIYDDLFSINKIRLKEIIKGLKEKEFLGKIKFSVYGRTNCLDEETAKLLNEMNVQDITFGFETGSQKLLTFLKGNNVTIKDGINAIKLSKKYNLNPGGFFILGSPTETLEDMKKTYCFIKDNCKENFIIYQTIPFPGTYLWDYALKNKIINDSFYEEKQKEFVDINPNLILSKEISKENFEIYFKKINSLYPAKKKSLTNKISMIKPRHIKLILTKEFLKKTNNLKGAFLKRLS
ncbi:MAG: radical SAM protein [Nanoarchaeota archaeon]